MKKTGLTINATDTTSISPPRTGIRTLLGVARHSQES